MRVVTRARIVAAAAIFSCILCAGQISSQHQSASGVPAAVQPSEADAPSGWLELGRDELQRGTTLTRQGKFKDAIPHLLAAQRGLTNEYALEFNLGLCYVGVGEYTKAVQILDGLRRGGHENADVENLLAQAYVGSGQGPQALATVERAAAIAPQNEKLFTFVTDACTDVNDFELGLKVVDIGLRNLPQSARLHYERAVFLSQLDQFDRAKPDFQLASTLGKGSEIGYLASAYENLLGGNVSEAIRISREGIKQGVQNPALLVILGKALLRSGIVPGQPEFAEAQAVLEKAVAQRPNDAGSQIGLGQIYLMSGQLDDAIAHLETARRMQPDQPSIYASLAKAYQRKGDSQSAHEALAERIRSAPGERKMSYGGNSSASPQ